ncbi:MAG: YXWGXW repeat-containing protein [Kofleriaceae bacterium]|nr:YXWGXW repeat-containing protein [Kofleriaceae bacterium]
MPRLLLLGSALLSVTACASRYHTEVVGRGTAIMQPRTDAAAVVSAGNPVAPWAIGQGITLPPGSYDLALWFDVPRAQIIDWTVTCPGVELTGSAGEAFEDYRARRLAELRAQRERDRQRLASVTSAVVGSVAPSMHGYVQTPGGTVTVEGDARLPADTIGGAVATRAIDDAVDLPPGDVGRGRLAQTVHVVTKGTGVCAVTAAADDPNVMGSYQVTRIRDLDAEARLRVMATNSAAMTVRGKLQARLVAHGADPRALERRRAAEAEARLRVEAEARARVEARLEVQAQAEAHARSVAMEARYALRGRCVRQGADPEHRTRIALQEQAMTHQAQETYRIEAEAHARLALDLEQRRLDLALRARTDLRARLVALGAIPRPPMPALLAEEPGDPPFPGARWTPGRWVWLNGSWQWQAGYWSDPSHFEEAGSSEVLIGVGTGVGVGVGTDIFEPIRDHRTEDRVRDHRTEATVRDHRTESRDAQIRDHRREEPRTPAPTVRDHRDDKKDDHDRDTKIRDHRR